MLLLLLGVIGFDAGVEGKKDLWLYGSLRTWRDVSRQGCGVLDA